MKTSRLSRLIALAALLTFCATASLRATTFTPTTTADTAISSTAAVNAAGQITDQGNVITLRSAVIAANTATGASGGANTIILGAGTYQLTIAGTGETASSGNALIGDLDVLAPTSGRNTLTVQGAGAGSTTIQQTTGIDRIFDAHPINLAGSVTFNLTDVTVKGGNITSASGGAILTGRPGDITALVNCVFDGNISPNNGGAITQSSGSASHDLNITNCIFKNNTGTNGSGGAVNYSGIGTVNIVGCTFTNNTAGSQGGGVNVNGTGSGIYNITACTFINNKCNDTVVGGGAIGSFNGQTLNVHFCRFIGNLSPSITPGATTGKVIGFGGGTLSSTNVFANQNWWGVNTGPAAFDVAQIVPTQWLQLRHSASPNSVAVGDTTTLTADLLGQNTGGAISAASLIGLPSFPASFSNQTKGTLSGAGTQFVNGQATATFTATSAGTGSTDAAADSQTVTAAITISTIVSSISRVHATPTNLTSVQWIVTFASAVSSVTSGNFSLANSGLGGTPGITSVTPVGGAPATQWAVTASTGHGIGTLGLNMDNSTGVSASIANLPFTGQIYTIDRVAPAVTCSTNFTVTANGNCPAVVNFTVTVSDNLALANATTNPASGSAFPLGTNTVTVTARDTAGNTNFCTFKVTVVAGAAPQLNIVRSGTNVVVSWTNVYGCYALQTAPVLASNNWSLYPGPFATNSGKIFVTNSSSAITNRFYRLSF